MLLVAITGPVGCGKSTALSILAIDAQLQGYSVDGFISEAGARVTPEKGAQSYTLVWTRTAKESPFAVRDSSGDFQLNEQTFEEMRSWANALAAQDLIVLDEFGKWEAEGNGLIEIWEGIEKSLPRMVVVTLREGVQAEVEGHIGRSFDRVLSLDPQTPKTIMKMLSELRDWERIGIYGAGSGGIEWSVGSWLHATKFPFVGTIMGSLQSAVLAIASDKLSRKSLTVWVSLISAGIKAMSPAGSRITPTIAITVQGSLFTLGATIFRWSRAGIAFGAFLVGIWAVLQGFFIQYLMLGKGLEKAWDAGVIFLVGKDHRDIPSLWTGAIALAVLNGCLTSAFTIFATLRHGSARASIETSMGNSPLSTSTSRSSIFRDLARPVFWLPLVLVAAILLFARESPLNILWMILRATTIVLVLGGFVRAFKMDGLLDWLRRRGQWGPAVALDVAKKQSSSKD